MDKPNSKFEVTAGWPGCALSAAIVLARAFSPGCLPMEEWSAWSWALMTAPAFLPWYTFAGCYAVWLAGTALLGLADLFRRR